MKISSYNRQWHVFGGTAVEELALRYGLVIYICRKPLDVRHGYPERAQVEGIVYLALRRLRSTTAGYRGYLRKKVR